ncbi:MAG: DUF2807 domain-containing protein [Bacteroidales bacterium]|jgi:hypothetical protein|nr:DUF2807 domain-containing protein [Bacteroidales bacterium]
MKRVLLFLIVAGLTTIAYGQKKETRPVSNFTGIDASSAFDITVTRGDTESLVIEADDAAMAYIRSEVRNGVLHLYLDNEKKVKNIKTMKATIVMKNLDRVSLSGACKFTANDLFTPDRFKGDCSGASNMTVNLNTGQLNIGASGASNIQINVNVTGNAELDLSGASKFRGELKAAAVKFSSSGVCSVDLSGSADSFNIEVSGTSKVNAGDFTVKTADIRSSGTSNITVNVADTLDVRSSGASAVNYKGSATISYVSTSGSSRVKKI